MSGLLVSVSGCLSSINESTEEPTETEIKDLDYDGVPKSEDDYPDNAAASKEIIDISESVTIPPTEFEPYQITAEKPGQIKYEAISKGGPIDIFFMDSKDYTKWQKNDGDAEYRVVLSKINTASHSTAQLLPKGDWVLALDHTTAQTSPNAEPVDVKFNLNVGIDARDDE